MCVENVRKWPKGKRKPQFGYKVFRILDDGIHTVFGEDDPPHEKGRWYKAGNRPEQKSRAYYPVGFHVFFTAEAAHFYKDYVSSPFATYVLQVEVKKHQIVCNTSRVGQDSLNTFITKYMKIIDDAVPRPRRSRWCRFKEAVRRVWQILF